MISTPKLSACLTLCLLTAASTRADEPGGGRIEETSTGIHSFAPDGSSGESVDLPAYMERIGPVATRWYQHVQTLANPWFEGREPGTPGGRRTAEYIAWHLDRSGCLPAFDSNDNEMINAMWTTDDAQGMSWYQPFDFNPGRGTRQLEEGQVRLGETDLSENDDFTVLGNSGSGTFTAPVSFVGYAIEDGPDGYESFDDATDLEGRVVLMLRYEPIDESGASRWGGESFSDHAGLNDKFRAVMDRGAVGIILVNPPGASYGRRGLESFRRSRRFRPTMDMPVVHISKEAADAFLAEADEQGRDMTTLRKLADEGQITTFDFRESVPAQLSTRVDNGLRTAQNVAGIHPGRGELADEWLVIGGHFDHLGRGYLGSREPDSTEIHYGADDNASGVGSMLLLARRLAEGDTGEDDRRSILFIGFDAEEAGLHGSDWFLDHCPIEHEQVIAMLNMDMMGRLRDNRLSISGTGTAEEFDEMLPRIVEPTGLVVSPNPGGRGPSDHSNFYDRDIPVLFFYTGDHDDYHTPRDHAWTMNPEGTARIIDLAGRIGEEMLTRPDMLTFKSSTGSGTARRTGAQVRLGIMPSYTSDLETGVLIDGVSDGTSAADAGLAEGDILLRWNDTEITDGSILMQELLKHAPGDTVTLLIRRGSDDLQVPVTLKSRDESS